MLPQIFEIPGLHIPIYGYGLMMVIGFLLAAHLAKYLANRSGLDGEIFINAALLALVSGVIGARLSHVLENFSDFTRSDRTVWQNFTAMLNLRSGGLTYYGGFLLAFPTLVIYGMKKKVPIRLGMDIIAPCLMIGLGLGRVGCFLNGCCYGAQCSENLPWAVHFPYHSNAYMDQLAAGRIQPPKELREVKDGREVILSPAEVKQSGDPRIIAAAHAEHSLPVHPAQLYSTITCGLLVALLLAYFTVPHRPGRVFAWMMILEGATRFLLEMLRSEPAVIGRGSLTFPTLPPMSLSMIIGIALVVMGVLLWWAFGRYPDRARIEQPAGLAAR